MIRLGDIRFLNSWPVTYALREGLVPGTFFSVVSGTPAELNRRLLTGELDASTASSMLYLRHLNEFVPIPGLCIRSDSGVHSVLVVSRQPLETLRGKKIGLSNQGATTPVLLRLLLKQRGLRVASESTSLRYPQILEEYPAALLIGDEALQASQALEGLFSWDLGEAWTRWTKLPMVFALWVVRRRLVERNPEILTQVRDALEASYGWSKTHPKELIAAMRKVFPLEVNALIRYLGALSYELDRKAWVGLKRFAKEAQRIGALPIGTTKKMRRWGIESSRRPLTVNA